jgi:hypothetical protein
MSFGVSGALRLCIWLARNFGKFLVLGLMDRGGVWCSGLCVVSPFSFFQGQIGAPRFFDSESSGDAAK